MTRRVRQKRANQRREAHDGPIARFVDQAFGGNIRDAATALGVSYFTLYRPVKEGRRPSERLIRALMTHTETGAEHWLDLTGYL